LRICKSRSSPMTPDSSQTHENRASCLYPQSSATLPCGGHGWWQSSPNRLQCESLHSSPRRESRSQGPRLGYSRPPLPRSSAFRAHICPNSRSRVIAPVRRMSERRMTDRQGPVSCVPGKGGSLHSLSNFPACGVRPFGYGSKSPGSSIDHVHCLPILPMQTAFPGRLKCCETRVGLTSRELEVLML
jgi:hypothetical protein